MKKWLFIFSYILFTKTSLATDWFQVGAKWTWDYRLCCTGDIYTDKWEIVKDTIIGVDTFNILNQFVRHLNENNRIIIREVNQKTYLWFNNQLLPICDFSKLEHDTSLFVSPRVNNQLDSFFYIIDSIKILQQNSSLKVQYGRLTPILYPNFPISYPQMIIEKTLFYGFENSYNFLAIETPMPSLRCYQDFESNFNLTNIACDSVIDNIKEKLNTNLPIKIFPNPVSDKIQVEFTVNKKYKTSKLEFYDFQGIQFKSIENIHLQNVGLDVSDYSNGIYYLKIIVDDEFLTKQIRINH